MKVLLGVTGSVAAKLTGKLIEQLLTAGHEVQVIASKSSLYFWKEDDLSPTVKDKVKIWQDEDEWPASGYVKDSLIPHIELVKWADVLLIAPLSKNTLFKIAYGAADSLLTCVAAAWWPLDETGMEMPKPLIIAPAMNTRMWLHPSTDEQLGKLGDSYMDSLIIVEPISRQLACGDTGVGALAAISNIVNAINTNE